MATVFDVAAYILRAHGEMTAMKLQKLVYYCQVWSVVWDERPMYGEPIEAWMNGPVVPALFAVHKGQFKVSSVDGNPDALSQEEQEAAAVVLETYMPMGAQELSDLSRSERPWQEARALEQAISLATIEEYYSAVLSEERALLFCLTWPTYVVPWAHETCARVPRPARRLVALHLRVPHHGASLSAGAVGRVRRRLQPPPRDGLRQGRREDLEGRALRGVALPSPRREAVVPREGDDVPPGRALPDQGVPLMGTPDTIEVDPIVAAELARMGLVCREGHVLDSLQTKDLDADLDTYVLSRMPGSPSSEQAPVHVMLFGPEEQEHRGLEYRPDAPSGEKGISQLKRRFFPTFAPLARGGRFEVACSTTCRKCLPVFHESPGRWDGGVGHREVWISVVLTFGAFGALQEVVVSAKTRDELRAEMRADGVGVLPDDDRIVAREIKDWREAR